MLIFGRAALLFSKLYSRSLFYIPIMRIHSSCILKVQGMPINMPSLSPTMTEGTIVKWLKNEGDSVQPGDVLCEIQTDKAVVSFETEEEGILAKILVAEDAKDVKIGTVIALMVDEGQDWKSVKIPKIATLDLQSSQVADKSPSTISTKKTLGKHGPSVRLLLDKFGLTADQVPPSGPYCKLLKGDVLKFIESGKNLIPETLRVSPLLQQSVPHPLPVYSEAFTDIELSSMRSIIAKRLVESKTTIPHSYSTLDCCINSLIHLRKQFKLDGINVSINNFIIKAVAVALTRCPELNAVWQNGQLTFPSQVDISVAVATDSGLITPIVFRADSLGVEEIAVQVADLASRARMNKLKLNEFQGGTFTISNLGMYGIVEFSAIINPPQCGILAVGGGQVVINENGDTETRMRATLSFDGSAVTDSEAAHFMEVLKDILENPNSILLGAYESVSGHPLKQLL